MGGSATAGRRIQIRGVVQGVGFRPWVYRTAICSGVTGRVLNDSSGVIIEAFGDAPALERFERALHTTAPAAARVVDYDSRPIQPEPVDRFVIDASEQAAERRVSIPPDLTICDDCLREIFDPAERRYRYPFTNCTNCGPRFTIATDVPYDRSATTMAVFAMCDACRREYEDPNDRRFHAQPNACPVCGPQVRLLPGVRLEPETTSDAASGSSWTSDVASGCSPLVSDPIATAADELIAGKIVAVKGIGGFHLACDATSQAAVLRLRRRKRREEKPLAVMVRSVADADAIGIVGAEERRQLGSVERPIVLLTKRASSAIAESVAPRNRQIGVMLAYSPLHHLLLAGAGRPLVMTSGNLSDEPIAFDNDEAIDRLRNVADLFVVHDRPIAARCDDSVVAVIAHSPTVIRRSRGFVPRPIRLGRPFARPVLACGALLKNAICMAAGDTAYLGPHIGDLENVETFDAFMDAIERFRRFLQITPDVIAHDMHPDYLSTRYALGRPEAIKVAVQHHHAHLASALAEHHLTGPVIGVAYDGTGYGLDGTSWGGEVMIVTAAGFERAGTFRPIALAGGDRAVREPWRAALALAMDAFDGEVSDGFRQLMRSVASREIDAVAALIAGGIQIAPARGIGRYFDAFGALFLDRPRAAFEGQVALEWNQVADGQAARAYPYGLGTAAALSEVDLRPAFRAALHDRLHGAPVPAISAAFHQTIAHATAALVREAAARVGRLPVVASGGCFQNARLAEAVRGALPGFDVRLHREVPPGDGGIALGQAVVADAVSRE
jgi:hydrogenase maturation protein HypF